MNFDSAVKYLKQSVRERIPSLDVSAASPIRWLLDAVAELHAQANLAHDRAINWDVNTKVGQDLDYFVELFGMFRQPGRHATGTVTLFFGSPITRGYLIPQGTELHSKNLGGITYTYLTSTQVGVPQYSSFATLPVIAEEIGPTYNIRANEINDINFDIEQLVAVRNERSIRGGSGDESDGDLQTRFKTDLFRDILGNEAWYRQIASRHPQVSAVQLLRPTQDAEEHLVIRDDQVKCVEDSLKYTYPNTFSVMLTKNNEWLVEERDFRVDIDNQTPSPPTIEFISSAHENGDSVIVRYHYCSRKSRNNPEANDLRYLDLFVRGNNPTQAIDFSTWGSKNVIGISNVNETTHPGSSNGRPFYVFVRQPVYEVPDEMEIRGRSYIKNRDYQLIKDSTVHFNSSNAKDILQWNSSLPEGNFFIPYYHDSVISDIQGVMDEPDMHTAIDDVLVHAAEEIEFDVEITVEWDRGRDNEEGMKEAVEDFFSQVKMGSRIRYGDIMKVLHDVPRVEAVFMEEISSNRTIRGRNKWRSDVPLPDGTTPSLGELIINVTAANDF